MEAKPAWPRLSCPAMRTTWKEYANIPVNASVVMMVSYPANKSDHPSLYGAEQALGP